MKNEDNEQKIEVTVRQQLSKNTVLWGCKGHYCTDWDVDPDTGRSVSTSYWESDENFEELFHKQQRTPMEIIMCCDKMAKQLILDGKHNYAGINMSDLRNDCSGWEEDELSVE